MITILVVDDSDQKIVQITQIIQSINIQADIFIASDLINARCVLNERRIDLLVLDQYLPLRIGEEINENGGVELIKELQKNRLNNIPRSIFGLSVAEKIEHSYFWPFHTHNEENAWIKPFKSLIQYTSLYIKRYGEDPPSYMQSIILEGVTDFLVINKVIELFFQAERDSIQLSFEKGSGCAWVVRQLFAKVFTLPKRSDGTIIKCAPLFDDDVAGNEAMEKINITIHTNQAERKHFKIFKYKASYSYILRIIERQLEQVTLEDLYPPQIWIWAFNEGILTKRDKPYFDYSSNLEEIINSCRRLDPTCDNNTLKQYVEIHANFFISREIKQKVALKFANASREYLETAAQPFKFLVGDILEYLQTSIT